MKRFKLLGPAVLAVLAVMAIFGVGSAAATTMCEEKTEGGACPESKRVALPASIASYVAPAQFSAGEYKMNCASSEMRLTVESNLGAGKGLSGQLSKLSFSGCASWGNQCSAPEVLHLPYKAEIQETTKGNGSLLLSSGGSGKPTLRFASCKFGATCTYSAEKLELGFEGAASPKAIVASNERLNLEEPNSCSTPGFLDISGNYGVQLLNFSATTSGVTLANKSNETSFSCGSSAMGGSLAGTISSLTFSGCGAVCTTAKAVSLPYSTSYSASGAESGTVSVTGFKWEVSGCPFGAKCTYTASGGSMTLDVEGSKIIASKEPLILDKPGLCSFFPETGFYSATYSKNGALLSLVSSP